MYMDELNELLANECNHRFSMDEPVMEKFIGLLTEVELPRGGVLTRYGQYDSNIYIIRDGILKLSYLEGDKESILAFGMNGSLLAQMHCYYMRRPSFFQCEACTDAVVMKIGKQEFDALVAESPYFARWVLDRTLDQLCGLEMSESERGHVFVFQRKGLKLVYYVYKLYLYYSERVAQNDELGIAIHKAACGAEMYYGLCGLRLIAERLYVRHDVVTHLAFVLFGGIVIDVVGKLLHFGYLTGSYVEPELHLRLGESYPEPAPEPEPPVVGKHFGHLPARISRYKRIVIY